VEPRAPSDRGIGSGLDAPAATHLGGEASILFLSRSRSEAVGLGFYVSYGQLWRDDGDAKRFRLGFIGTGRRNALTVDFGWERLLTADVITINFGFARLPAL